jgi:hypothetical protein
MGSKYCRKAAQKSCSRALFMGWSDHFKAREEQEKTLEQMQTH